MPVDRSHIPSSEIAESWPHLKSVAEEIPPVQDCEVGLLIGYNCAKALIPRVVIAPEIDGPFAQKTDLGWGIVGITSQESVFEDESDPIGVSHHVTVCQVDKCLAVKGSTASNVVFAFRTKVKEVLNPVDVVQMMNLEFNERKNGVGLSLEDQKFLDIVGSGVRQVDGHYEMPLPIRDDKLCLPHNRCLALRRLNHLKVRLQRDQELYDHYCAFMKGMINKGYAEKVPVQNLQRNDGEVWYVPHHGVYHPKKPKKIRVVFDCSAQFQGESLNKHLLQGPDLTNTLVGVLCRFRKESIAVVCDIEQMFFQFQVSAERRDLLRFLWWENGDLDSDPIEFRMCVHLFGAASSPGCANFGLKQMASDFEEEFGKDVASFVRRDFYVDDGLTSKASVSQAESLIMRSKDMFSRGGLRLHKFLSNSKTLLQQIPADERAGSFANINLLSDTLPIERALGVQWCVESDSFRFRITLSDRPLTRRGVLATVNSVYDPLGFIAPVVLAGKQILQQLCTDQLDWDSPIPESLRAKWDFWRRDLLNLDTLTISRCFKPDEFGEVITAQMHHFSDASQSGYGQCSYLRLVDNKDQVHCSLVMGKSRVAPLKAVTVPRLELTAALVSVKVGSLLQQELDLGSIQNIYWTDSKVVLGYISNESRRFHVYVANRVQQIRDLTDLSQWRYVETDQNPADIASRGASVRELIDGHTWIPGPKFLWDLELPEHPVYLPSVPHDDCELKKVQSFGVKTDVKYASLCERLKYFSSWKRAKRAVALCIRYVRNLKLKISSKISQSGDCTNCVVEGVCKAPEVSLDQLTEAECLIIKFVQAESFRDEVTSLKKAQVDHDKVRDEDSTRSGKTPLKKNSSISHLNPMLDESGILRVGGRMQRSSMDRCITHPIILPRKSHVSDLVIRHYHEFANHQGRGITSKRNQIKWFLDYWS